MTPLTADRTQPALFGGLVMGVLSALPIVSAGNWCCCLWVVSGGLVAQDRPPDALELAGADHLFHPATAKILHDTLIVTSPEVREPVAVRYAWRNAPDANLYSGNGLPVVPFRSDDW
jgi:hypothetical protein